MYDPPAKFSLSLGPKKPATLARPTKRPHATFDESDNEEEVVQTQTILSFGDEVKKEEKKALVIPAQKNRDWREESQRKRQRSGLPAAVQNEVDITGKENEGAKGMPAGFGLTVMERKNGDTGDTEMADGQSAQNGDSEPVKERTIDEEAMARLLGEKAQSILVVPVTEDDALQMDVNEAPDMASLDAYDAMPIDQFGSALLRGMGWKEGEAIGRKKGQAEAKPRVVQRRAALLGIGAKEDAAVGVEMGAWGKGAKGPKNLTRQEYTPVVMKNAKTGETLTEKELQDKIAQQKLVESDRVRDIKRRSPDHDSDYKSDKSSHRQKYIEYDDRDKDRRRDRSREKDTRRDRSRDRDRNHDRDRDSYKHKSSRRDRSSSVDSRDHRRRRDGDRDRDDRREKERHRRDRDRSYNRGSSRRDRR